MDLLTVLGHVLGYLHQDSGVMIDTLPTGTRRTPGSAVSLCDLAGVDGLSAFADLESPTSGKHR